MRIAYRRLAGGALALASLSLMTGAVSAQDSGSSRAYAPRSRSTEVTRHSETGLVRAMSGTAARPVARANATTRLLSAPAAARSFVTGEVAAFGIADARQLALVSTRRSAGRTVVKLQQLVDGVPVLGGQLNIQLDRDRNVISANGETIVTPRLSTQPAVTAAEARTVALGATAGRYRLDARTLFATRPSLAIHDSRIFGGRPRPEPRLVWRVDVTARATDPLQEIVLVDAQNGRVQLQFSQVAHAAPPASATQRVCNANNTATKLPCTPPDAVSNPGSSTNADVKNAFKFAENTFDFYARRFGRNSIDGAGLTVVSTVKYCDPSSACPYANAFWTSQFAQMVYGAGFAAADDVVGHELTHGVTSFESNLFYFFQSGAINESLSDIFGELIDQTNAAGTDTAAVKWKVGEDVPGFGAIRDMKDPTVFGDPDRILSPNYTADLSGVDQGGVHTNSGVANKAAYLMTEPGTRTFNGKTVTGLGIDKSAAIWYRVNSTLLTTSSDYQDLHVALRQACADLTGTTPKNGSGGASSSGPITAANCQEVKDAVDATEMNLQQASNKWPIPFEAPYCTGGLTPVNALLEKFKGPSSGWAFTPEAGGNWSTIKFYAEGGKSVRVGDATSTPAAFDTSLRQNAGVTLPANAFLRFDHYYNLYGPAGNMPGGIVEYQIGAGAVTRVPDAMFTHNPYNRTVTNPATVLNTLTAFTYFSGGWTSSRIDLSSLVGQSVKFRFRVVAGTAGAWDAWLLDNVQVYTCA